jgi:hypothetical protein
VIISADNDFGELLAAARGATEARLFTCPVRD